MIRVTVYAAMLFFSFLLLGCSESEMPGEAVPTGRSVSYDLVQNDAMVVSGTVEFVEYDDNSISIEINLNGAVASETYETHLHYNNFIDGGVIASTLKSVNGATGESKTIITTLDNGTKISFDELIDFDGHINIHSDDRIIIAYTDIGQNELTGNSKSYDLLEADNSGIMGLVTFFERKNNETIALIELDNTDPNVNYPAHIHENSVAETGLKIIPLSLVSGLTGKSTTNITELLDNTTITYNQLLELNGHLNIHASETNLDSYAAQANIGVNVEETDAIVYNVTNSGSSAYIFNGNGLTNASNPALTLKRGLTYIFNISASGHPFYIKTNQSTGAGDAYNEGVTNNGTDNSSIIIEVSADAPGSLFYNCSRHSAMTNSITITN